MLTQSELRNLVDTIDDEEVIYEPSYTYKKKNYKWFNINSRYWKCKAFNINLGFGKCTIIKPYQSWECNSIGKRLDKNCIYLVSKNKWFSVQYKNYVDDDRAFDSSMKALVKYAKAYLTKTSR